MEVVEDVVEGVLVLRAGVGSVLTEGSNGVGNVRASGKHGIHECPHGTLICFDINFGGGEFSEVLVREDRSENGVSVKHAIPLKHILYIFLLQESDPACVLVLGDLNAKNLGDLP